jgi:hypothetical protein
MEGSKTAGTGGHSRSEAHLARRFAWGFGAVAVMLVIFLSVVGTEWRDAMKSVLDRGGRLRAVHYGHWGVWWGCAADAVLCAALALTSRWWARAPGTTVPPPSTTRRMTRNAWIGLLAMLALAGALRWERMGLSFYNDEAHTFRRYIGGQHLRHEDGSVEWRQVTWTETIWLNKVGNNSVPCSLFGRLSYDAWRTLADAPAGQLGERAVRLPVFLAAMAGLVVLWLLMRRLFPGSDACWWALALAALHPWHVRYSSEARGHGFLLLGVPLCFYYLQRALEDNRWRWWIGMGLAQFFCAWSFPGAISFLAVFNGLLLLCLAWRAWRKQDAWNRLARPLVGMAVGGMIALPVMLPIMQQLAEVMKVLPSLMGHMGFDWWQDVLGLLAGGAGWGDHDAANPQNLALSRIAASHAWAWLLAPPAALPLGFGIYRTARCGGLAGLLAILAGPLAAAGMWLLMWQQGKVLYLWYVIFALPGLLIVWAAGADGLVAAVKMPAARLALAALLALPMAGFAWVDSRIVFAGKENLRGVAQAVPAGALHGTLFSDVDLYDPDVILLRNLADLEGLIQKARAEKRPLYVSLSHRGGDAMFEEFYRRVGDAAVFEQVAVFPGQEDPQFTHYLYRLRK